MVTRRFNDSTKWKLQRWFRLLEPEYKLSWEYINAQCDDGGVWKINVPDLNDDLRLRTPLNLVSFIDTVNKDFNEITGESVINERLIIINDKYLWITTYVFDQCQDKLNQVNPANPFSGNSLKALANHNYLAEAIRKNFIPLPEHYMGVLGGMDTPLGGCKEKEKEKEREINKNIVSLFYPELPKKRGKRRQNGTGDEGEAGKPPLNVVRGGRGEDQTGDLEDIPAMTAKEFLEFEAKMLDDHIFIDPLRASKGNMNIDTLKKWIIEFHAHIAGDDNLKKDYKEYKKHFKNYINLKWANGLPVPAKNGKGVNNGRQGVPELSEDEVNKYAKKTTNT